jgi:cell division protein FtsB
MPANETRSTYIVSRFLLILIAALLLYLVANFARQAAVSYQRQKELEQMQAAVAAAQAENEQLKAYADYAKSDPAAEEWARSQGWAKAGEIPVIVVAPQGSAAPAPAESAPADQPASHRHEWWSLFFGTR